MFHSLVVLSRAGEVLLSRFYGVLSGAEEMAFVAQLRRIEGGAGGGGGGGGTPVERVAVVGAVEVVYLSLGPLSFFLGGEGDYDCLVCGEVLQLLCEGILAQCEKDLSENEFLAQYDRISLLVDHIIRHGRLEHTSKSALAALVGLSPETITSPTMLRETDLERVSVAGATVPALKLAVGGPPKRNVNSSAASSAAALSGSSSAGMPGLNKRAESQIVVLNKSTKK